MASPHKESNKRPRYKAADARRPAKRQAGKSIPPEATPASAPKKRMPRNSQAIRINKYLADRGIATRRNADEYIKRGLVLINGRVATLGDRVLPSDVIAVNDTTLEKEAFVYFAYYKKAGIETLPSKGEKGILQATHFPARVFPIGRLDKDSEGLIIMTNDGRITNRLLNPKFSHEKEYAVTVDKPLTDMFLRRMRDGVMIGYREKTKKAKVRRIDKETFEIAITEGKNRQIRRMCAAFGYNVKKLKRFRVMNIELGKLKPGTFRPIEGKELAAFMQSLGL